MRAVCLKCGQYLLLVFGFIFNAQIGAKRERSYQRTFLILAVVVIIGIGVNRNAIKFNNYPLNEYAHTYRSLQIAVNNIACDKRSYLADSQKYLLSSLSDFGHDPFNKRILDLPELLAGSKENYCKHMTMPFVNNENSLMLLFEAILRLRPNTTLSALGNELIWIGIAAFILFACLLLRIGFSLIYVLSSFVIGVKIIGLFNVHVSHFTYHRMFLPFILLLVSILGFLLNFKAHRIDSSAVICSAFVGAFSLIFFNLRTSYLPIITALFLVYLFFAYIDLKDIEQRKARRIFKIIVILASYFVGAILTHVALFKPIFEINGNGKDISYHSIAHPLVLGLSVPFNELAAREGVEWSDNVGKELVEKFDPRVNWKDKRKNEETLFAYYLNLWKMYPGEMANIYKDKFMIVGYDMLRVERKAQETKLISRIARDVLVTPMRLLLPNGMAFLALFFIMALVTSIVSLTGRININSTASFVIISMSLTSFMNLIENGVTYPYFTLQFGATYFYWTLCCSLLFYQVCANGIYNVISTMVIGQYYSKAR